MADGSQIFTVRGLLVGLAIGTVICFSNMYFGLQTGWISGMSMPSALVGFAVYKTIFRNLRLPFSPAENVFVQSVSGSVGTMPLGCGLVGVIPALEFLLKPAENGPLKLSLFKLIIWSVGICFFGVVFAVPLRKQAIIKEKLKFPTGTATAMLIGVLHGRRDQKGQVKHGQEEEAVLRGGDTQRLLNTDTTQPDPESPVHVLDETDPHMLDDGHSAVDMEAEDVDWKANIRLLTICVIISGLYTITTYFIPELRYIPIIPSLSPRWLWYLNPSPAYIGQGIIMGPVTTSHMFLGAVVGWGILSPLAKYKRWAPGPVSDWGSGSKGWIVWVSLAIMLADAIVGLSWLAINPLWRLLRRRYPQISSRRVLALFKGYRAQYRVTESILAEDTAQVTDVPLSDYPIPEDDVHPSAIISQKVFISGLILSIALAMVSVQYTFHNLVPLEYTILALLLSFPLSVVGVRALGETDLNPVSGISKITQLIFAALVPRHEKNAIIINLVAGAISESGAVQSGDLMQDIKTGHLLGAAPNAQFYGQIIGSAVGAVVSAVVYKLYTNVYNVPGKLFEVPTAYVWIYAARLITGRGLPPMVGVWASGAGALFTISTIARIYANSKGKWWGPIIPSGVAVAVGMYNTPSFTLARAVGGIIAWYWQTCMKQDAPIVLASGLILGEGFFSIFNLVLASLSVPHL